jgi:hypothetical protein
MNIICKKSNVSNVNILIKHQPYIFNLDKDA